MLQACNGPVLTWASQQVIGTNDFWGPNTNSQILFFPANEEKWKPYFQKIMFFQDNFEDIKLYIFWIPDKISNNKNLSKKSFNRNATDDRPLIDKVC